MIALDTNILLDILIEDSPHNVETTGTLAMLSTDTPLIISEPVFAELSPQFPNRGFLEEFLREVGVRYAASPLPALHLAGATWRRYLERRPKGLECPRCGRRSDVACANCGFSLQPRQHIIADFLVGAHALTNEAELFTRDRSFFSRYFPDLQLR